MAAVATKSVGHFYEGGSRLGKVDVLQYSCSQICGSSAPKSVAAVATKSVGLFYEGGSRLGKVDVKQYFYCP